MKKMILILVLTVSGCAGVTPPPSCEGEARRINPPNVSVSAVICPAKEAV